MNNTAHSIRPEPTTGWTPPSSPTPVNDDNDNTDTFSKQHAAPFSSAAVAAPAPQPSLYEELIQHHQEQQDEVDEQDPSNPVYPTSPGSDRKPSARDIMDSSIPATSSLSSSHRRSSKNNPMGTYRQPIPRDYFTTTSKSNHSTTSFADDDNHNNHYDAADEQYAGGDYSESPPALRQSVTTSVLPSLSSASSSNNARTRRRRSSHHQSQQTQTLSNTNSHGRRSSFQSLSMGASASLDADLAMMRNPLESSWHNLSTSTHHLQSQPPPQIRQQQSKNDNGNGQPSSLRNPLESSWHTLSTSTHHLASYSRHAPPNNDATATSGHVDDIDALLAQRLQQEEEEAAAQQLQLQQQQSTHSTSTSSISAFSGHLPTSSQIQSIEDAEDEALALRLQQEEEARARPNTSYLEEDEALAHQLLQQEEEAMRRRSDPSLIQEDEELARQLQQELSLQDGGPSSSSSSLHTDSNRESSNPRSTPASTTHGFDEHHTDDEALARQLQEMEESARRPSNTVVDDDPLLSQAGDRQEQERILAHIRRENERRQLEWAMSQGQNSGVGLLPNAHVVRLEDSNNDYAHSPRQRQQQPQLVPASIRYADSPPSSPRRNGRSHNHSDRPVEARNEDVEDIYPSAYRLPTERTFSMPTSYGLETEDSPRHPMAHQPPPVSHQRQEIVMRGQQETVEAIQSGQAHVIPCRGCGVRLQAPVHYSLVYCPTCGFVSPGSGSGAPSTGGNPNGTRQWA